MILLYCFLLSDFIFFYLLKFLWLHNHILFFCLFFFFWFFLSDHYVSRSRGVFDLVFIWHAVTRTCKLFICLHVSILDARGYNTDHLRSRSRQNFVWVNQRKSIKFRKRGSSTLVHQLNYQLLSSNRVTESNSLAYLH